MSVPRRLTRVTRGIIARLALRLPPFVRFLPVHQPLPAERHVAPVVAGERDLLVLMPGIADSPEDYRRWGFVELLHAGERPCDAIAVDSHYGYYARGTVLERLHEDVIRPARAVYRRVWLAGISMGGFGALLYASRYEGEVSGVIALAPYLGGPPLVDEIAGAGGLPRWIPAPAGRDHVRWVWTWLKQYEQAPERVPSLYLAYGERDKFAPAHRLLAAVLPKERVFVERGAHDWPTWRRLWGRLLAAGALPPP
ncbi:alpha/beta hydrolase-fold protein [Candidatus Nitrospira bockiana]